jgi:hypothetical protein
MTTSYCRHRPPQWRRPAPRRADEPRLGSGTLPSLPRKHSGHLRTGGFDATEVRADPRLAEVVDVAPPHVASALSTTRTRVADVSNLRVIVWGGAPMTSQTCARRCALRLPPRSSTGRAQPPMIITGTTARCSRRRTAPRRCRARLGWLAQSVVCPNRRRRRRQ